MSLLTSANIYAAMHTRPGAQKCRSDDPNDGDACLATLEWSDGSNVTRAGVDFVSVDDSHYNNPDYMGCFRQWDAGRYTDNMCSAEHYALCQYECPGNGG